MPDELPILIPAQSSDSRKRLTLSFRNALPVMPQPLQGLRHTAIIGVQLDVELTSCGFQAVIMNPMRPAMRQRLIAERH